MTNDNPATSRRHFLLVALCVLAFVGAWPSTSSAWPFDHVKGDGKIVRQSRPLPHFTGVSLGLPGQVELTVGDSEGVTVETDGNLLDLVETVVEKGELQIRARKRANIGPTRLKISVQARQVEHLAVGGPGSIDATGLRSARLKLEVGGSGAIMVKNIDVDAVSAEIGGSGRMKMEGAARKLSLEIGGSGDVDAGRLKSADVQVSIAGSGDATVWAGNALKIAVAGSGDVNYYGDPMVQTSVAGSGTARRLGAAPR